MSDPVAHLVRGVWIFYTIGMSIGFLRIGIRTYLTRRVGVEELIMLGSMVFWTGDSVLSVVLLKNGTNQVSDEVRATLTPAEINKLELGSKALITAWFCYITMIWGLKTCLLIFYKKLMQRVTQMRILQFAAYALGITYTVCILSMFLVCRPFRKNWQVVPDPGPQCTDGYEYVWVVGIMNILTDAMMLGIPLPVVIKLHISLTQKAMLCALFGSGIFVIIATILRIHFTIGGDIANLTFWCMIETCSAMLVVNAPGIVSIFTKSRSDHGNSYEFKSTSHSASRNHTKSYINSDDPHYHAQIARNSIAIPGTDEAHHTTIISSNRPPLGSGIGFDGTESQERIISPRNSNSPHDHLQDIDIDLEDGMGMRRVGEKGDKMVIHQKVTYEVTAEQLSTTRRSSNSSEHSSGGSIDKSGRPASEMH